MRITIRLFRGAALAIGCRPEMFKFLHFSYNTFFSGLFLGSANHNFSDE